jgi:hypothetical protein
MHRNRRKLCGFHGRHYSANLGVENERMARIATQSQDPIVSPGEWSGQQVYEESAHYRSENNLEFCWPYITRHVTNSMCDKHTV